LQVDIVVACLNPVHACAGSASPAAPEEALRLQPKSASTHYNLGLVFREQNREDDAAGEFRQALAIDPQFRPAREALRQVAAKPN
jgi:Tfp pilus assembly protein PilF